MSHSLQKLTRSERFLFIIMTLEIIDEYYRKCPSVCSIVQFSPGPLRSVSSVKYLHECFFFFFFFLNEKKRIWYHLDFSTFYISFRLKFWSSRSENNCFLWELKWQTFRRLNDDFILIFRPIFLRKGLSSSHLKNFD